MAIYNSVGRGLPTFLAAVLGGYFLESHGYRWLSCLYALAPLAEVTVLSALGKHILPRAHSLRGSLRIRRTPATSPAR